MSNFTRPNEKGEYEIAEESAQLCSNVLVRVARPVLSPGAGVGRGLSGSAGTVL